MPNNLLNSSEIGILDSQLRTRNRQGITLIEVTLGMFLGTFLLLVTFQSFFLAAKYRLTAGEAHHFGLSLTNSIRDFTSDMNAHIPQIFPKSNKQGIRSASNGKLVESNAILPLFGLQDSFSGISNETWVSFVGHPNYCAFQTPTSHSRFSHLPTDAIRSGNSLIVWWHSTGQSMSLDGWRSDDLIVTKSILNPMKLRGLIRTQFYTDTSGEEKQVSEVINPDVTSLHLEYFDGKSPVKLWDSETSRGSPIAVSIKMQLMDQEIEQWIRIPSAIRNRP